MTAALLDMTWLHAATPREGSERSHVAVVYAHVHLLFGVLTSVNSPCTIFFSGTLLLPTCITFMLDMC